MGVARKAKLLAPPSFIEPCLLTTVKTPPDHERWIHEIKHDGYRLMVRIDQGRVQLRTRSGLDWSPRFPLVVEGAKLLPVQNAYLDGEVVVQSATGHSDWPALHASATNKWSPHANLWAFDLLFLNGKDLRALPLIERKEMLAEIIPGGIPGIRYVEHLEGDGEVIFEHACQLGLEGIVSKQRDKRYQSGRSTYWLKTKCLQRQAFVIAGYLPLTGRKGAVGALILGSRSELGLIRVGKVGTGFTHRSAIELAKTLDAVQRPTHPFDEKVSRREYPGAAWVEPVYEANIEFRGWSGDGLLRHCAYKGLAEREEAA